MTPDWASFLLHYVKKLDQSAKNELALGALARLVRLGNRDEPMRIYSIGPASNHRKRLVGRRVHVAGVARLLRVGCPVLFHKYKVRNHIDVLPFLRVHD